MTETTTAATPVIASVPAALPGKWWGHSMTIWGALITAAATVLPALGPILGPILGIQLTREPARIAQADIDLLHTHGIDDAAIHDAIQVIGYFNYINRIADAVGIEDEPEWT